MATAFTGVQRSQPTFATRPVPDAEDASAAAAFRATALARVPPNQAAKPRSCSERETVLRAMTALQVTRRQDPVRTQTPDRHTPHLGPNEPAVPFRPWLET